MALLAGQTALGRELSRGLGGRRRNKFNAVRTVVDGIPFDSKKEATYWSLLRLRERAGAIRNLERQTVHELHAPNGEVLGVYRDDFSYEELVAGRWRRFTVDVKSKATRTALYRWKRKHMMAEHGIRVHEV
jgi:hypothetical protein